MLFWSPLRIHVSNLQEQPCQPHHRTSWPYWADVATQWYILPYGYEGLSFFCYVFKVMSFFSAIYVELKKSCLWIERADVSPVALLEAHHLGMKHIRRPLTKFHSPLLSCNIASHREPGVGRMAEAPCQRSRRSQVQFTLGGLPGHVLNPRGVRGPEFSGSPGSLSPKKKCFTWNLKKLMPLSHVHLVCYINGSRHLDMITTRARTLPQPGLVEEWENSKNPFWE